MGDSIFLECHVPQNSTLVTFQIPGKRIFSIFDEVLCDQEGSQPQERSRILNNSLNLNYKTNTCHWNMILATNQALKTLKIAFFPLWRPKKVEVLILGPTNRTGPGPYYGFLHMGTSIVYYPGISSWVLDLLLI